MLARPSLSHSSIAVNSVPGITNPIPPTLWDVVPPWVMCDILARWRLDREEGQSSEQVAVATAGLPYTSRDHGLQVAPL